MKYSLALVKTAEDWVRQHGLIDYGGGQLQDFIKVLGIDDKTYRRWMIEKEDFKTAIERAKEDYKKTLTHDLQEVRTGSDFFVSFPDMLNEQIKQYQKQGYIVVF